MIIRMMYVLPMILGRTYDVRTNSVGVDIFPTEDTRNTRVTEESFYRSTYRTVESSSDVREVLEVDGALSLAIKAGALAVRGIGAYVKSTAHAQDSVDVLFKVSFRTVSESLPHSARPVPGWSSLRPEFLGTHFVQSVLYGGDLIARVRFRATHTEDLQEIRATVKAALSGGGGALDLIGEGRLETLDEQLQRRARMEIDYFATVPLEGVPNTAEGLRALVRQFEEHVKKVNGGKGVPVEVELRELSAFDTKFEHVKNLALETELEFFEEYLDDLLSTKSRMKALFFEYPNELGKEVLKQLSQLSGRTGAVLRQFHATIAALDLSKGAAQLDAAKDAYREGKGLGMAGKFRRELNKILKKVNSSLVFEEEHSSVFVRFGASQCPSGDAAVVRLYGGHTASSPRTQIGSGQDLLCAPTSPSSAKGGREDGGGGPEEKKEKKDDEGPRVAGVKYGLMRRAPFAVPPDKPMSGVACAVCMAKRRTVFTFYGVGECPPEGNWRPLYSGFLMVPAETGRAEGACVDSLLEAGKEAGGRNEQSVDFATLRGDFVKCAVCSK